MRLGLAFITISKILLRLNAIYFSEFVFGGGHDRYEARDKRTEDVVR